MNDVSAIVYEVGPRDGLQNDAAVLSTADKIAFVNALSDAGLPAIEVTAFVRADRVPQMADAEAVAAGIVRRPGTRYSALVPNRHGLEQALTTGFDEVAIVVAASETFNQRNIGRTVAESISEYIEVVTRAFAEHVRVRAYLSTAFGCPFEGEIPLARVTTLTRQLIDLGVFEVAVSDTIGVAHPGQVRRVVSALADVVPINRLAVHFHDTRGTALANALAAYDLGVRTFDASAGGLGGCPFAPGASGNLATEDLVYMLEGLGARPGVRLEALAAASTSIEMKVGHALPSRYLQARRLAI